MALAGSGLSERDSTPPDVVIHEVSWAGTQASTADEWIELKSNLDHDVSLAGWRLAAEDGTPTVTLCGTVTAQGYYLLERTDDSTVADIAADVFFTGTLENSGETLYLFDSSGQLVDSVECGTGWFAGEPAPTFATMERVNPRRPGASSNWRTNDGVTQNGHDAAGQLLRGTPKAANSVTKPPLANFAFSPENPTLWDDVVFIDLSTDVDGEVTSWQWEFGDGATSKTRSAVHRFRAAGTYGVALTIEDDDGLVDRVATWISTGTGPGDLNGDGQVDVIDVRLLLQLAQGVGGSVTPENADVDRDGDVDLDDVRELAELILGL